MKTVGKLSEREMAAEIRKLRRALQELSDTVLMGIDNMDRNIAHRRDMPGDLSLWLGKWIQALDQANDGVRYSVLRVDFRRDDKKKAVQKILKARGGAQ